MLKALRLTILMMLFCVSAFAADTYKFTDMAGRTVDMPKQVTKVFSTNPIGTLYLYAIAPEKIAGINWPITPMEKKYTSEQYQKLPNLGGNFGGKKITMNYEEILKVKPDFIIHISDINPMNIDTANKLQAQLNIPVIVLDGNIVKTAEVISAIGRVSGSEKKARVLADYYSKTMKDVKAALAKVPADKKVTVYYAEGAKGLETDPSGSNHAEVIDIAGGKNVASIQETPGFGRTPVSMEQVMGWNADFIIVCSDQGFSTDRFYTTIFSDPLWAGLKAVKAKNVYETPFAPFNWMDRPPSVNRIMGVIWMTNLLYPRQYKVDIKAKTKEFYSLFYNMKLTDAQVNEILATSVRK